MPPPDVLDETGTSGDLSEIVVRCECGRSRPMTQSRSAGLPGRCSRDRPWLGPNSREDCGEMNRLLARHASNACFPQVWSGR